LTFKEEFPSLSKAIFIDTPGESLIDSDRKAIKKYCLDKQRVKDAIINYLQEVGGLSPDMESSEPEELMAALLIEELGLEE